MRTVILCSFKVDIGHSEVNEAWKSSGGRAPMQYMGVGKSRLDVEVKNSSSRKPGT